MGKLLPGPVRPCWRRLLVGALEETGPAPALCLAEPRGTRVGSELFVCTGRCNPLSCRCCSVAGLRDRSVRLQRQLYTVV